MLKSNDRKTPSLPGIAQKWQKKKHRGKKPPQKHKKNTRHSCTSYEKGALLTSAEHGEDPVLRAGVPRRHSRSRWEQLQPAPSQTL